MSSCEPVFDGGTELRGRDALVARELVERCERTLARRPGGPFGSSSAGADAVLVAEGAWLASLRALSMLADRLTGRADVDCSMGNPPGVGSSWPQTVRLKPLRALHRWQCETPAAPAKPRPHQPACW
jgi:hypothetical protein